MSPRRREGEPGPTASTRLADDLRQQILRGELPPGTPLREEALSETAGVSRHTVRAALALLASERLLTQVPYQGIRVRTFTAGDLVASQQLRCALESEAVRIIRDAHGSPWPPEVRAPIEAALARLEQLAEASPDDWPGLARAHAAVHRAIVAAAQSPRIEETYALLDSEMLLLLVNMRPTYSAHDLVAEHRAYLDEVAQEGADAVRRHIDGGTLNAVTADLA